MSENEMIVSTNGHLYKNLIGKRFTMLLVTKNIGMHDRHRMWECVCDCGKTFVARGNRLERGHTKSCGCYHWKFAITHGLSDSPEHGAWLHIKQRCFQKKNKSFKNYGGRGITMCDGWRLSMNKFLDEMGQRPSDTHSIDRINNNGHYSCGNCDHCRKMGWKKNCRWATDIDQCNNCRKNVFLTAQGKTMTIAQWARFAGIKKQTIYFRFTRGWPDEKIIGHPVLKRMTNGRRTSPLQTSTSRKNSDGSGKG